MGVLYVPDARDSDNEYADGEDLQKAVWDYHRAGYFKARDTHTNREIGEVVEIMTWPVEHIAEVRTGDGQVMKYKLPAGTVYAGVIWSPEAWTLVKSGKLRGYSLGGRAVRMKDAASDDAMPRMGHLVGKGTSTAPALTANADLASIVRTAQADYATGWTDLTPAPAVAKHRPAESAVASALEALRSIEPERATKTTRPGTTFASVLAALRTPRN